MPELPEVEIVSRQLNQEIKGYTIQDIWWDFDKILRPKPEVFSEIIGQEIKQVGRRGKWIVFEFTNLNKVMLAHLKLTGRLLVREGGETADKYVHAAFGLSKDGGSCSLNARDCDKELRFSNSRKFGYFELFEAEQAWDKLSKLGPEFLDDLDLESFKKILNKTSRKIKEVLMDQSRLTGAGNIYANDALWEARIHPQTRANQLDENQVEKLFDALENVLQDGIKYGGASDNWYRNVYGEKGFYQDHFRVYGKKGKPCQRCGSTIEYIKLGGRGTFFCPVCQQV